MYQIKVRVWDRKEKRWLGPDDFSNHIYYADKGCDKRGIYGLHLGGYAEDEDLDWLLSIGHRDRNETEIYDGDITKIHYWVGPDNEDWKEEEIVTVVCWADHLASFVFRENTKYKPRIFQMDCRFDEDKIEILGNINDNPELLE